MTVEELMLQDVQDVLKAEGCTNIFVAREVFDSFIIRASFIRGEKEFNITITREKKVYKIRVDEYFGKLMTVFVTDVQKIANVVQETLRNTHSSCLFL